MLGQGGSQGPWHAFGNQTGSEASSPSFVKPSFFLALCFPLGKGWGRSFLCSVLLMTAHSVLIHARDMAKGNGTFMIVIVT